MRHFSADQQASSGPRCFNMDAGIYSDTSTGWTHVTGNTLAHVQLGQFGARTNQQRNVLSSWVSD